MRLTFEVLVRTTVGSGEWEVGSGEWEVGGEVGSGEWEDTPITPCAKYLA